MLSTIYIIFVFVAVLGVLIFVHELGHFLLAKALGVGVLKFSLGFGPKIIGKRIGETEYLISALPLGGYVKMLGEVPDEDVKVEETDRSFSNQTPWRKMAIVVAGPVFNILLTILLYTFVYTFGVQVLSSVVGYVEKDSPAYQAGIRSKDKIVEVDGLEIGDWGGVESLIMEKIDEKTSITILREGREMAVEVIPRKTIAKNIFQEPIEIGTIGIWPFISTVVGEVMEGSPAKIGGLKSGDKIVAVAGVAVGQWSGIVDVIQESPGKELSFKVERGEEIVNLKITPAPYTEKLSDGREKTIGRIGISSGEPDMRNLIIKRYNPFTAFFMGVEQTWSIVKLTLIVIKKLIARDISADNIAGPIGIAQMTGQVAKQGLVSLIFFMALLSVNLGILNLLPIPILDGGHLIFFTFEIIMGRPLSGKNLEIAQKIGLMLLVLIMVLAFYNDILRLLNG